MQNFYVLCFELGEVLTEPGDLILSSTGEGKRQKRDDGFLTAKARERPRLPVVRTEREVRRLGADL